MSLVYIGKVVEINPIPGADRIESLEVVCGKGGRWRGTAAKGQFRSGDACQIYLQDCVVPQTPEFTFMERYNHRVRMMRFRGVPSEVLVMPQTIAGEVGDDVTEQAGVTRFVKPIPASLAGDILGWFPSFIPKTDEPNFQSVPAIVEALRGKPYVVTVKCDGSSATFYRYEDHFGCCSRNLELKDTPHNSIWNIAREFRLAELLPDGIAIQAEIVGPGIQKNPMGLGRVEARMFNAYEIRRSRYLGHDAALTLAYQIGIPFVPVVAIGQSFDLDDEQLRRLAEGVYDNGKPREGVVIRHPEESRMPTGERISFKVINLLYKD